MTRLFLLLLLLPGVAVADTVVAARTLRAESVIGPDDLATEPDTVPGGLSDPAQALGKEARVVLYAGRPILADQIGPPALVDRNQIVELAYRNGGLTIRAEGRALARAGEGETVRVMNTSSHSTVSGVVAADGTVIVGGP